MDKNQTLQTEVLESSCKKTGLLKNKLLIVVGWKLAPAKDAHVLIPQFCEYITLQGKKNFVKVTVLRSMRWQVSWVTQWVQ